MAKTTMNKVKPNQRQLEKYLQHIHSKNHYLKRFFNQKKIEIKDVEWDKDSNRQFFKNYIYNNSEKLSSNINYKRG